MAGAVNNDGNSGPRLHLAPRLVVLNLRQQHVAHLPVIPTAGLVPGKELCMDPLLGKYSGILALRFALLGEKDATGEAFCRT